MTDFLTGNVGYVFMVLGVISRMLIPWLVEIYKAQNGWDWKWKYLRGQLVSTAIVFIGLPLLIGDVSAVNEMAWQLAWLAGYGTAEVGRFIDKAITE